MMNRSLKQSCATTSGLNSVASLQATHSEPTCEIRGPHSGWRECLDVSR